jgi:polyisoprenoid-binding protein YceI
MRRSLGLYLLTGALLASAVGCADPTADAPDAVVDEAAPELSSKAADTTGATVYQLSEDSTVGFVGAKVTGSHTGGFSSFEGVVSVTDGTPEGSSVEVVIDTTSIWADNEKLTGHLKSSDFFDVEVFPTATFSSTAIAANEDGTYTLTGNLQLHGVTKQISFPARIEVDDQGFTAAAEFTINRMDFDIKYPGKPDDLIRDEVLIKLDLRSRSPDEPAAAGDEKAAG